MLECSFFFLERFSSPIYFSANWLSAWYGKNSSDISTDAIDLFCIINRSHEYK
jgi:hypothetical protein